MMVAADPPSTAISAIIVSWPTGAFVDEPCTVALLYQILRYLDPPEILRCGRVARPWLETVDRICAAAVQSQALDRRFNVSEIENPNQRTGRGLVGALIRGQLQVEVAGLGDTSTRAVHRPMAAGVHAATFSVNYGEDGGDGALTATLHQGKGLCGTEAYNRTAVTVYLPLVRGGGLDTVQGIEEPLLGMPNQWGVVPHESWATDRFASFDRTRQFEFKTFYGQRVPDRTGTTPDDAWAYYVENPFTLIVDLDRRLLTISGMKKRQWGSRERFDIPDQFVDPVSIRLPPKVQGEEAWYWESFVSDLNVERDEVAIICEPIVL